MSLKKHITVLAFFFLCAVINGQEKQLDSLWSIKKNTAESDTNRLRAMEELSWSYLYSNMDTALHIANEALELAESLQFDKEKKWKGRILNVLGGAYLVSADYPKSLDYYFQALEIQEKRGNKTGIGTACTNIGSVYSKQADFPNSLKYSLKALKALEESTDKKMFSNAHTRVGNVYFALQDYPRSIGYYEKALKIAEAAEFKGGVGKSLHNIGLAYLQQENLPKALDYLARSLEIFTKLDNKVSMGNSYEKMGLIFFKQGELKKAMEYEMTALKISREVDDKSFRGSCYQNIANIHAKLKDYKAAVRYADSSLQMAKAIGQLNMQRLAYQGLSDFYRDAGDYKNAYENHVEFKILTDSIFNADNSKQMGDLKTQFEVDKKEAELKLKAEAQEALNAEEKKRQQIVIYSVAGILLVVLIFSVMLFQRFRLTNKQKRIIEQQKAQVDHAYDQLHERNTEVMDSINYARRIQRAQMPTERYIEKSLNRLMKKK